MKLLLLRCPDCQEPLSPEPEAVVVGCKGCFTAVSLTDTGLSPIDIQYAAAQDVVEEWVPFWLFNGRVHITQRETQGSNRGAQKDSEEFWGVPRRLYVPAWNLSMPAAREMGQTFVKQQTNLIAVPRPQNARLVDATVTPEDALKLLEFVVISIEAERKDWLKKFNFHLEVGEPELWALPARRKDARWVFYLQTEP
jgi:hypothetical protein